MTNISTMTQKFNVDVGANRILRFDQNWYQVPTPEGIKDFKGVTTVLDVYPKGIGFKLWLQRTGADADTIRDEAGQLGSHVHKLIEMTLRGETVTFEDEKANRICTLEEWEKYMRWCAWYQLAREEDEFEPLFIEQIVFDPLQEVAGTIDCIAKTSRGLRIKDWKTGSYIGDTAEIQVAKYMQMANAMKSFGQITGADIIHLSAQNKQGFKEIEVENYGEQLESWDHTHAIWMRINKNAKPKYRVYPNTVSLEVLNGEKLNFNGESK